MSYTYNKLVKGSFDEVKEKVIESVKIEKFGIITEINFSGIVKNKIEKEMPRYEILGACSPKIAYNVVSADEEVGAFLPCNITLMDKGNGEIKVSIVNPVVYMQAVENKEVLKIAEEVGEVMKRISDSL